jgi:hypothetical protein
MVLEGILADRHAIPAMKMDKQEREMAENNTI